MGQKIHSVGLRLGINRHFDSLWYDQSYQQSLRKEQLIRKAIHSFLSILPFLHLGRVFFQKSSKKTLISLFLCRRKESQRKKARSRFFFRASRLKHKGSQLLFLKNPNLSIFSLYLLNQSTLVKEDNNLLYKDIDAFNDSQFAKESILTKKKELFNYPFLWNFNSTKKLKQFDNFKLPKFISTNKEAIYLLTSKNILNSSSSEERQTIKNQTVFELNSLLKFYRNFEKNSRELSKKTIQKQNLKIWHPKKTQKQSARFLKPFQRIGKTDQIVNETKNPTKNQQFLQLEQKQTIYNLNKTPQFSKKGQQLSQGPLLQLNKNENSLTLTNKTQQEIDNKSVQALNSLRLAPEYQGKHSIFVRLEQSLSLLAKENIQVNPIITSNLTHSAAFLAEEIAYLFEKAKKKKTPIRLIKKLIAKLSKRCLGVRIICSGRLGGVAMAKKFAIKKGRTSLNMFSQKVDFTKTTALTKYGIIGIKVWISFQESSKAGIQSEKKTIKKPIKPKLKKL